MANLALTAANIRPLDGAITRGFYLASAVTLGDVVYITSATTYPESGVIARADGNVSATVTQARGICVAIGGGKSTGAAGDRATVVVLGPVAGFTSLTPNALGYVSNDVGKLEDAAGSFTRIMGYAESATVFFVLPEQSVAASA